MARTRRETVSLKEIEIALQEDMALQEEMESMIDEEYEEYLAQKKSPWDEFLEYCEWATSNGIEPSTFDEYYNI